MAPTAEAEGSEDVSDFLLRIRELGDKRDKEDEERTKKLEEEILQGRKERQARRAERARSISPTKDSPLPDLSRLSLSLGPSAIDPPENLQPSSQTPEPDPSASSVLKHDNITSAAEEKSATPTSRDHSLGASPGPTSERTMSGRSRSGTLSWQQRPASRDLRSGLSSSSPTRESSLRLGAAIGGDDTELSKSQIASSLAAKDASWFRQTADRGIGSPALRKSPEEAMPDNASISGSARLPGLSRESTTEPEKPAVQDLAEDRSRSPSRASSTFGNSSLGNRYSSVSSVSTTGGLGSPFPLSNAPKLEARKVESSSPGPEDRVPSSPSQRRVSPERPVSPTKGLGGFVQSAMMKRSDSVSKRWSAQAVPGLNRGSSVASSRSGIGSSGLGDLSPAIPETKFVREGSPLSISRPGSSHSEATVVHHTKPSERPGTSEGLGSRGELASDEVFVKPPLPSHSRSASKVEGLPPQSPRSPSPSKTMDPKRWSPTKATWLESALNRPESPKQTRQSVQQPAWLKDLNRTRQSRGSVDLGKPAGFKEVTPLGLMRSPSPGSHYKKPSISGISETLNSPEASRTKDLEAKPAADNKETNASSAESNEDPPQSPKEQEKQPDTETKSVENATPPKRSPSALSTRPSSALSGTSSVESVPSKPKQQPPVMDFRANLRRRDINADKGSQQEPEFKNVFGKLRKAETKNYVAPDELKHNILKGKAALNMTGGFRKSQRVDELKESILKQKEAMKAGGGTVRRSTIEEKEVPALETPVPEAIARRNRLSRSDSAHSNVSGAGLTSPASERPQSKQSWRERQPLPKQNSKDSKDLESLGAASKTGTSDATKTETLDLQDTAGGSEGDSSQAQSEALETEAKQKDSNEETIQPVRALPSRNDAGAARVAAATKGLATKGTLAGRINPALAGILSRGPPIAGGEAGEAGKPSMAPSTGSITTSSPQSAGSTSSTTLTHMTKARARGPKRRLPKSTVTTASSSVGEDKPISSSPAPASPETKAQTYTPRSVADKDAGWPLPTHFASAKVSKEQEPPSTPQKAADERPKLAVANRSPELRKAALRTSTSSLLQDSKGDAADEQGEQLPAKHYVEPEMEPSPKPTGISRKTEDRGDSTGRPIPPPKSTGLPSSSTSTSTPKQDQPRTYPSPRPLMSNLKENRLDPWQNREQKPVVGLGIEASLSESKPRSPQNKTLPSPPVPPKKSDVSLGISLNTAVDPNRRPSLTSPIPRTTESTETIHRFFATFPRPSDRVDIDPQLILTTRADRPKIRTLKKQIWEIAGDGKKQDLPVNQEYILYEGSMYLCVHVLESNGATKSEVHLWCGDDVGEAAIEDAQLFARKVARENSCKLELLRQGKETANFIQALGGIIMTRRGSSSRSSSSALYMLCGRRHLGQITFDEVDFSRRNLCSGYPFVISARFGKLYLWKGRGSGADEIGSARLIGMDIGLTGEIEEVDEGEEPDSFFEIFPGYKETATYLSSDHWHLKPKYEKYYYRLLRVDHELGQRTGFWNRRGSSSPITRPNDTVQEIEPFCQKDLGPRSIYVLDAFFELYVIVGEQASFRSADFASALFFAHEYGILAASLEDRPFIPKSFVAIGGVPESCQTVFRKWDKRIWKKPIKVLPLNAAIEAIRS